MTPSLVRQHLARSGPSRSHGSHQPADSCTRARDWAEIQERMLVPLYEAVYDRLDVGPGTRLLGLGCGSGLALLIAAARGAEVSGVDSDDERLDLARERLAPHTPQETREGAPHSARLAHGGPERTVAPEEPAFNLVTAFHPVGCVSSVEGLTTSLVTAGRLAERGSPVVLGGWGPAERCSTAGVLRVAQRLADPLRTTGGWRPSGRDDLEELADRAGLRPDGSGRVACPFGYSDLTSAVRGLLSTGLFDAALEVTDQAQVEKELSEALHPHQRGDGTVWMPNVFRYLVART
ncbi:methyltransferase domain-containing protein [Streptomyces sp. MST-110588]|uniref:methyltransferase domain-containing protein n=1 Tax=Streptomyces sp. MST-110588 TaxID=2833628 RepID=UPI001F5D2FEA|nr:methyltransferase domain-containing protein [Streptomyces sp. MST-110588]UNO39713.1 class I SAM-dependent methyltransferase [Streptomyces sp. MST-110588]